MGDRFLMLDVDGVVVTGRPGDGLHWSTGLEADLGVSPAALQADFFAPRWDRIVRGLDPLRPTLDRALAAGSLPMCAGTLVDYWFRNDSRLDHDLLDAVGEARRGGWTVILATNQEPERAAYLWRTLGLRDHADGLLTSAGLGAAKPEAAFWERAEAHTGGSASDHVLVDDSAANVASARAHGWKAVHWPDPRGLAECLRDVAGA